MPPADYEEWYRLVRALATHLLERHGIAKLSTWKFEVWNEMWGMPYPSAYLPLHDKRTLPVGNLMEGKSDEGGEKRVGARRGELH